MTQQENPQPIQEQTPRILLVVDEPQLLSRLESSFEQHGYDVETAQDGRAALWSIRQKQPDVVICDYLMPYMDGGELLSKVRSHERFRSLPFVMIGAPEEAAFGPAQEGADIFLPKPRDPQSLADLLAHVQALIEGGTYEQKAATEPGLKGDLAHLSLPDLMQVLHQNRRSGRLEVHQGKQRYVFVLREGALLQVRAYPAGLQGEKALFRALQKEGGDFLFHSESAEDLAEIEGDAALMPLEFALMEGIRQRDEYELLLKRLPSRDVLFLRTEKPSSTDLSELARLLLHVFQRTGEGVSLRFLLDKLDEATDLAVLESLLTLRDEGYLTAKASEVASSGALETLPVDLELLVDARRRPAPRRQKQPLLLEDFAQALVACDEARVLQVIEAAFQEGASAESIYRKMLGSGIWRILQGATAHGGAPPPPLPALHGMLRMVMERLWPFFAGRPPIHGMIVLGRPVGESGSSEMLVDFLRAAGFGAIDLGSRVTPSRFLEATVSSGASLLCLMLRTEAGVQMTYYIRQLLDRQGMQKIPILVGGPFLGRFPDQFRFTGADALADDALDVIRKTCQLLDISMEETV